MVDRKLHVEINADDMMEMIRHLSVEIGPRHPTSRAEREASEYVYQMIAKIKGEQWELFDQPFRSVDGFRYRTAPLALLAGLVQLFGLRKDRQSQFVSGVVSVGLSIMLRDAFLGRSSVWEAWMPRGESQNVIVRIPPRHKVTRRVVYIAHVDSGVSRITTHPRIVRELPRTYGILTVFALVGGVLTALSGKNQRWRTIRSLIGGGELVSSALSVVDEMGPNIAGANGNASGVAVLLELADTLRQRALDNTEVVLVFTGAETAVSTGAEALVTEYGQAWEDALWVVVSNVGQGELCWVTRHGISPYAHYHPHPDAVRVMERVADARPDLGLMGKEMLTVDEAALLWDHDLRAVTLMGYDRVTGMIPNWRQNSDTIHEINPATVERAAHTVWTTARVVDQADDWPLLP